MKVFFTHWVQIKLSMPQKDPKTLLLVENSPDICTLIELSLAPISSLQVQTVPTGEEGIAVIQSARPSLIILDLDTSNYAPIQQVIAKLEPPIPVLLLSSRVRLSDQLMSNKQGTTSIQKPFEPELLKQMISDILAKQL